MKLVRKYRRYSLAVLTVVLVLGCVSQYCIYSYSIHRTTDDVLREYRRDIEEYAAEHDSLMTFSSVELKHSYLRAVGNRTGRAPRIDETICDSLLYSVYEGEPIVYRVLNFPVSTTRQDYIVTLTLPTLEQHELVAAVVISSLGLFLLFVGASLFALRYMDRVLNPFYCLLNRMRNYDIRARIPAPPEPTDIDEFNELGEGLYGMMQRMHHGYGALKELVENTSHELQTPLAVVQMKLERLQQLCMGSEEQMQCIAEVQDAMRRMSRYNRSLMLIARISSDRFYQRERIDLTRLAERFFRECGEILSARSLQVEWHREGNFSANLHPILAEILLNNILSNAVKYSDDGGRIVVWCDVSGLSVENAYSNAIPDGDLFERYIRSHEHTASTGLGLPIVREICIRNGLIVSVDFTAGRFRLRLRLSEA